MNWLAIAQIAAQVLGSASQAKSAKDASGKAAKGSKQAIDFLRESRDIARADTQQARQAGSTALNALMSLTGLAPGGAATYENGWPTENTGGAMLPGAAPQTPAPAQPGFMPNAQPIMGRQTGYTYQRATGGPVHYNINEIGPENVFTNGAVTRHSQPMTIGDQEGYVQGRSLGGFLKKLAPPGTIGTKYDPIFGGSSGGSKKKSAIAPDTPSTIKTDINTNLGTDYSFQTDPGYQFRFEEGQRALDRGAAARGGLLSGGYGRKAIRYGQGFASNEYTNVYNRIANIAGMGQTANQFAGNAALNAGANMSGAAAAQGINSAYGAIGAGNAWNSLGNNLALMDWSKIFGGQ